MGKRSKRKQTEVEFWWRWLERVAAEVSEKRWAKLQRDAEAERYIDWRARRDIPLLVAMVRVERARVARLEGVLRNLNAGLRDVVPESQEANDG